MNMVVTEEWQVQRFALPSPQAQLDSEAERKQKISALSLSNKINQNLQCDELTGR